MDFEKTTYSYQQTEEGLKKYFYAVYGWMTVGILISGIVALLTIRTPFLLKLVFGNPFTIFILILIELGLVYFLSSSITTLSKSRAQTFFIIYSALNGLTLSSIFLIYTRTSIADVFFITAGMFGISSFLGFTTKANLASWGRILFMGLIGLIIASIVSIFIRNSLLYMIISVAGVILFTALTAYDTQYLKSLYLYSNTNNYTDNEALISNLAILGALKLYLDFINLFLYLLRLFGRRD